MLPLRSALSRHWKKKYSFLPRSCFGSKFILPCSFQCHIPTGVFPWPVSIVVIRFQSLKKETLVGNTFLKNKGKISSYFYIFIWNNYDTPLPILLNQQWCSWLKRNKLVCKSQQTKSLPEFSSAAGCRKEHKSAEELSSASLQRKNPRTLLQTAQGTDQVFGWQEHTDAMGATVPGTWNILWRKLSQRGGIPTNKEHSTLRETQNCGFQLGIYGPSNFFLLVTISKA